MEGHRLQLEFAVRAAVEVVGGAAIIALDANGDPLLPLPVAVVVVLAVAALIRALVTGPYVRGALRAPAWDPHASPTSRFASAARGASIPLIVVLALFVSVLRPGTLAGAVMLGDAIASLLAAVAIHRWERRSGTVLLRRGGTFSQDVLIPGFNVWWGHAPAGDFLALGERPPRR